MSRRLAAFDVPRAPLAPALDALAHVERAIRAVVRWMRSAQPPLRAADLIGARSASRRASPSPTLQRHLGERPFVFLPAVAWDYRFQRPQQLARALVALGYPVLYVEGFLRTTIQPRVRARSDANGVLRLTLRIPGRPDPYRSILDASVAELLAERLAKVVRGPAQAIVCQLPFWAPLACRLRDLLAAPLVYDRLDLHSGFPEIPPSVPAAEVKLIKDADLFTASAEPLLASREERSGPSVLLPNAVALSDFRLAEPRSSRVRVGYVGALADWFDTAAVARLARDRPDWELALAGRVESAAVAQLAGLGNIRLPGEIPYSAVPEFLAGLHVLIIPFRDLPLTRAVDPVKVYEALAAGLPVVARDLPPLRHWGPPFVYLYREIDELALRIDQALVDARKVAPADRCDLVRTRTWEERARTLLSILP